ncbi:unnamed protein product [Chironomus riparius]|uniref:Uncharacterized protein n=1 Tax=Chironomus riparius TaxID=315576 RepID=A0A9N9S907_9DIPT|nr:unnamed protein product [Chironomus riparius]
MFQIEACMKNRFPTQNEMIIKLKSKNTQLVSVKEYIHNYYIYNQAVSSIPCATLAFLICMTLGGAAFYTLLYFFDTHSFQTIYIQRPLYIAFLSVSRIGSGSLKPSNPLMQIASVVYTIYDLVTFSMIINIICDKLRHHYKRANIKIIGEHLGELTSGHAQLKRRKSKFEMSV